MKFVFFKKSLEEGASPVYLFEGEEEYFKERGEEMLKEKFLSEPSLNYTAFAGEALKGAAVTAMVSAAESFPFFGQKRIVKATEFYPTEKEYEQYLQKYFADPQPTTILLIVNSHAAQGKAFDLKKAPNVTFVDCSKGDDETLLRWIYTRFKRAGIRADTECCERVMRYCLSDMSRIAGETEKLIDYACESGSVTSEDVDLVVYKDAAYKTYEMTSAVGAKNYGKYIAVCAELLEKGMDEMGILNALCAYFRTLYGITAIRKDDKETARILGMKEYAVKMSRRQAQALGERRVQALYRYTFEAVNSVKTGKCTLASALLRVNAAIFGEQNIAGQGQ